MALYTQEFSDFLTDNESSTDWTAIINRFASFPTFNINSVNIDAYSMFRRKYLEREIGSETPQRFCRYVNMQLDVALIEYMPKIKAFIDKYNDLFDKQVVMDKDGTEKTDHTDDHTGNYSDSGSSDEKSFMNPTSSSTDKIKDRVYTGLANTRTFNNDKHSIDHDVTFDWTITKDLEISNAEFLTDIQNVKNYYNEMIDSFDICFMGCY